MLSTRLAGGQRLQCLGRALGLLLEGSFPREACQAWLPGTAFGSGIQDRPEKWTFKQEPDSSPYSFLFKHFTTWFDLTDAWVVKTTGIFPRRFRVRGEMTLLWKMREVKERSGSQEQLVQKHWFRGTLVTQSGVTRVQIKARTGKRCYEQTKL